MTQSVVIQTELADSQMAGTVLGRQVSDAFGRQPVDAIILFVSSVYHYQSLLKAVVAECAPAVLIGCSSSGEFADGVPSSSSARGVAIRSSDLKFGVGIGRGLSESRADAVRSIVSTFHGASEPAYHFRSALLLTDALAGYTEELLEQLTLATAGQYQVFGGGAGDDAKFSRTNVFYGDEAITDAAVALEILSNKPLGIGVSHGWEPASPPMLVTEASGMRLVSLNAMPAVDVFEEHAKTKGQSFDATNPLPFFLHNVIGIDTEAGYKLRVPLAAEPEGAIVCAAEIPTGCTVRIMSADGVSASDAADRATRAALSQLEPGASPALALFFDCAATRLRLGNGFSSELSRVAEQLASTHFIGCNTYGQIARVDGQFSGFHNCTAVICVIPQ